MKTLLITYHTQTGNTKQLVDAARRGANAIDSPITVNCKPTHDVSVTEMQQSDGYIFATPENFGYMSGELKALFDRTYYDAREQTAGKSYALLISCDNDGQGAVKAIQRILLGYNMKDSQLCHIAKNPQAQTDLDAAYDIGLYFAEALSLGAI
ncbi:flavodoxin family protein [Ostreibacterium oceani]|uniref:Flavodoxin n=1 Tax=Ostreibacterium oceani TaxID=2654998 RepID=A0A6N7ERR3_9GAMM|nr:NAD(P)H-dependent oxidoreductase [Ostreibacterium oceani]MPV85231.1 flavodoxin [Ostreibacterium oceani]